MVHEDKNFLKQFPELEEIDAELAANNEATQWFEKLRDEATSERKLHKIINEDPNTEKIEGALLLLELIEENRRNGMEGEDLYYDPAREVDTFREQIIDTFEFSDDDF